MTEDGKAKEEGKSVSLPNMHEIFLSLPGADLNI